MLTEEVARKWVRQAEMNEVVRGVECLVRHGTYFEIEISNELPTEVSLAKRPVFASDEP